MTKGSRRRLAALLVVVVLLSAWACTHAGGALVVSRDASPPDAILMLASHEWERLPAAAVAARQYPRSIVILTVPLKATQWNCRNCAERPAQLGAEGVAPERIVELAGDPAANTHGEALSVSRYLKTHPIERLLIVTSPYHTRRALHTFEHVLAPLGVEVGVLPAYPFSPANPRRWWLGVYDRDYVAYEWAAVLTYRVKYGVPIW